MRNFHSQTIPKRNTNAAAPVQVVAAYSYQSRESGRMSLRSGDVITVQQFTDKDLGYGKNQRSEEQGYFYRAWVNDAAPNPSADLVGSSDSQ